MFPPAVGGGKHIFIVQFNIIIYKLKIQLSSYYCTIKRETYLTVKILNRGVSLVTERIIDVMADIDFKDERIENPVQAIVDLFSRKLEMKYDPSLVESVI